MWEKTAKALKSRKKAKITKLAEIMMEKRDWRKTALLYDQIIFAPRYELEEKPALVYIRR